MDILVELPVELSIRVLEYLTPAESIRLRLVSKSFHSLLTSEEVCRSLSHRFVKREYNSAKKLESWRLHYENHVSRRLSFGSGKAWLTESLPLMYLKSFCPETLYLAGALGSERDTVQVLDLNTYPAALVFPPTRMPDSSKVKRVTLLPSFVVALTTTNRGYSWNLETRRVYQFEAPERDDPADGFITGNGNLIAIPSRDFVMVHDVQAEKSSKFGSISVDTESREWMGSVPEYLGSFAVANAEKRVVWILRKFAYIDFFEPEPYAMDGLYWEAGKVVAGELSNYPYSVQPYCEDGYWQLWGVESLLCRPGPTKETTHAQTSRAIFDTRTGAWTKGKYSVIFPSRFKMTRSCSSLRTRSDGLGCLVENRPELQVWMLDQKPGHWVAHARPLDPNILTKDWNLFSFNCFGLSDKFVLLGDSTEEAVVVRFRGIHE